MRAIPAVVQHLRSRTDCSPEIQRGTGHPRRARALEGTAEVDATGAGYRLRSSCGVGHLYSDDACIVSRSPQGLAKMMEVIVEVCRAFALTVSAKKIETMCMPPPRIPRTMVHIEAAGQTYKQVQSFAYLGGAVTEVPDMCSLKSPDGPAHAGCVSGGTYGSSTTNRKSRSPSRLDPND